MASPNATRDIYQNTLEAVTCPAAHVCFATGYVVTPEFRNRPLALRWNGSAWKVLPTPVPSGRKWTRLSGVDCLTGKRCVAVGTREEGNARHIVLEQWNGSAWSLITYPDITGAPVALQGVACRVNMCFAVGTHDTLHRPRYTTLVLRYF